MNRLLRLAVLTRWSAVLTLKTEKPLAGGERPK
jgi:hypothetical protein